MEREILYVPDFLANCGGLIHVSTEWYGDRGPREPELIAGAMERLELALETAEAEGIAADRGGRAPGARARGRPPARG